LILVDAGPMVALLRQADRHHRRCVAALRRIRDPLCTVWPAVTEAMLLLSDRPDAQSALAGKLESAAIALLPLDRRDVPRIRELMAKYGDLPMDFTDAALVRAAERDGLETIFTTDRRDFSVYRISGRRRFRIVP
jgi:predicted nucleic acid-binding protein